MSDPLTEMRAEIAELRERHRVDGLRIDALEAIAADHRERLELHDGRFEAFEQAQARLHQAIHSVGGDVLRCNSAATANTGSIEMLARQVREESRQLTSMSDMLKEIRRLLQPSVVA